MRASISDDCSMSLPGQNGICSIPWDVLSIHSVDEKGGFILLKKNKTILRMESTGQNALSLRLSRG